jgi:hypothetical protein
LKIALDSPFGNEFTYNEEILERIKKYGALAGNRVLPDEEAGRAAYDVAVRNSLITQLTRIELGKTIEQAHMRSRALVSHWVYEKGKPDNVISKETKDGKTFFVINDYQKLRDFYGEIIDVKISYPDDYVGRCFATARNTRF